MTWTGEKAVYDQLQGELNRIKNAISPQVAAKEIRDFMEANSKDDMLAGTADGPNPWLVTAKSDGGCCVIS